MMQRLAVLAGLFIYPNVDFVNISVVKYMLVFCTNLNGFIILMMYVGGPYEGKKSSDFSTGSSIDNEQYFDGNGGNYIGYSFI